MNRKWLSLSALALVLMGAGLFWAKWKQDNPALTTKDEIVRQHLLTAKEAYVRGRGQSRFYHVLSDAERREIAQHIFLLAPSKTDYPNGSYELSFGTPTKFSDTIYIGRSSHLDSYAGGTFSRGAMLIPGTTSLHPKTSRHIRRWIEEHLQNGKWISG